MPKIRRVFEEYLAHNFEVRLYFFIRRKVAKNLLNTQQQKLLLYFILAGLLIVVHTRFPFSAAYHIL